MEPNVYDLFYDEHGETIITWRNLPHWKQSGKLYFITWRQADSLPQKHLVQLRADRAAWDRQHGKRPVHALHGPAREEYYRLLHHRVQAWLDAGHGSCLLRRPEARRIMIDALHCFNGQRYRLGSFALAGNHVHLLVAPLPGVDLSKVLHSWKSFTANAINKAVGHSGTLWRDESYDRLVRDPAHLQRVEEYIAAHVRQGAYVERIPVAGLEG
jgi:REP element-mobilizing transposase RayT